MVLPRETVFAGLPLPYPGAEPEVLSSGGVRYYIGFTGEDGSPYSRESGYYRTPEDAAEALMEGWYGRETNYRPRTTSRRPGKPAPRRAPRYADMEEGSQQRCRDAWAELEHPGDRWTADELEFVCSLRAKSLKWRDIAVLIDRCMLSQSAPNLMGTGVSNAWRAWRTRGVAPPIRPGTFGTDAEWRSAHAA